MTDKELKEVYYVLKECSRFLDYLAHISRQDNLTLKAMQHTVAP